MVTVARAVGDWDPRVDLFGQRSLERLFDSEATLYAIALSGPCDLSVSYRRQRIERGDLVVVPAGLAIDVSPTADFLVIRHSGPMPYHFRERFLQIWGFEHIPLAPTGPEPGEDWRTETRIAPGDERHRISYQTLENHGNIALYHGKTGIELTLALGLSGLSSLGTEEPGGSIDLPVGGLAVIGPNSAWNLSGTGEIGLVTLKVELGEALPPGRGVLSPEWPA